MPELNVQRPGVEPDRLLDAQNYVVRELERRLKEHGQGVFASTHEIMGVAEEEMQEAWDATRANDRWVLMCELADLAVAALFGIASLAQHMGATGMPDKELTDD